MKCDIYEEDGIYNIELDIPGYKKEDIKIECEDGILTIKIEKVKQESRRYAKRQLTWFRRDERVNWIYPDSFEDGVEYSRTKVIEKAIEIMENSGN